LIAGVNHTRRIFAQPAGALHRRGGRARARNQSDEDFGTFARNAGTSVFTVGTCKMGTDPAQSLTPQRVLGLTGLRVIDASIMRP
jgi:choline dehydrogenase-like flavoprotein